jgi:hypothetical protein
MSSTTADTTTSSALVTRIRDQWAVVQAQWVNMPDTLRRTWEQVGDRIRTALDLPTKDELAALATRLDQLDARLNELAAAKGLPADPLVDAVLPASSKIVAEKRSRKHKA